MRTKKQDSCWNRSTEMWRSSASFIRILCKNIAYNAITKKTNASFTQMLYSPSSHQSWFEKMGSTKKKKSKTSFICTFSFNRHFLLFLNCCNTNINNELKVKQITDDTVNTEPHVVLAQVRMEMNLGFKLFMFLFGVAEIKFLQGPQKKQHKEHKIMPQKQKWPRSKPGKQTKHHFTDFTAS